jgi:TPR repeat protein
MNRIIALVTLICLSTHHALADTQPTQDELCAEAQERLEVGEHYYWGNGVAQNNTTAHKYFEGVLKLEEYNPRAAARASCWIGQIEYTKNPSSDVAASYLEKAAEQILDMEAKIFALMRLGTIAMDGDSGPANPLLAKKYFERAVQVSAKVNWTFPKATSALCLGILQFTLAEKLNYERARDAILQNIEHVSLHHQLVGTLILGKMFLQGVGGPQDVTLAIQCFKQVISLAEQLLKQGSFWSTQYRLWQTEAQAELGLLYFHGDDAELDREQARNYLTAARTSFLFAKLDDKLRQRVETACSKWRLN